MAGEASDSLLERADEAGGIARPLPWLAAWTLCRREMVRFVRQPNRVVGAIGQPLLFWLLFGAGLHHAFRLSPAGGSGQSFMEYFFPGTLILILLFTAIFATISVIEDRRAGFLQSVLVAPIPRWSMVLGKVAGGALIALLQGLLFLLLALTIQVQADAGSLAALVVLMLVASLGLTSLGFVVAWPMQSTQGFHAIMNMVLIPLWLLSGAFFPVPPAGGPGGWTQLVLHWIMRLNPVTYAVGGVRRLLFADLPGQAFYTPSLGTCWLVTVGFAAVMFAAACWMAGRPVAGDLR